MFARSNHLLFGLGDSREESGVNGRQSPMEGPMEGRGLRCRRALPLRSAGTSVAGGAVGLVPGAPPGEAPGFSLLLCKFHVAEPHGASAGKKPSICGSLSLGITELQEEKQSGRMGAEKQPPSTSQACSSFVLPSVVFAS